jgi:hypothetical protein
MALKCLKWHSVKIPARYEKAFSGFDTFCQYLKIEFIDLSNYSQKECLTQDKLNITAINAFVTMHAINSERENMEIIRIFKA